MRHLEVLARLDGRVAAKVYPVLCDYQRYPACTEAVRSVRVTPREDGHVVSDWEVVFRRGILRWTELDRFNSDTFRIEFEQISGDINHFSGEWAIHDDRQGCSVRFTADFDLGIPSLSDLLDPVAEQALRENVNSILVGLLGEPVEIVSEEAVASRREARSK
jgi:ribosome-associated toxin RatA of RatAB toxin-antitoxin module